MLLALIFPIVIELRAANLVPSDAHCMLLVRTLCVRIYDYDVQGNCLANINKYYWSCPAVALCEDIQEQAAQDLDERLNDCLIEIRGHSYSNDTLEKCRQRAVVDKAQCLHESQFPPPSR